MKLIIEEDESLTLNPETFAFALRAHQERLGKTQKQMADLLGVSLRIYITWQKGDGNPLEVTMEGAIARLRKAKPGKA